MNYEHDDLIRDHTDAVPSWAHNCASVTSLRYMTSKEAASFNIPDHERERYFRTVTTSNHSPLDVSDWLELITVILDNGDPVDVVVPWAGVYQNG